jgi:hypothetical protein
MEPGKVDEVIHVLELAREEAKKMSAARGRRAADGDKAVVRAITGRSANTLLQQDARTDRATAASRFSKWTVRRSWFGLSSQTVNPSASCR